MLKILDSFSLVWVLVYRHSLSPRLCKWLWILKWMNISSKHFKQILHALLISIDLQILRKISICRRWFLFGVSLYVNFHTLKSSNNEQQYQGEKNLSWNV